MLKRYVKCLFSVFIAHRVHIFSRKAGMISRVWLVYRETDISYMLIYQFRYLKRPINENLKKERWDGRHHSTMLRVLMQHSLSTRGHCGTSLLALRVFGMPQTSKVGQRVKNNDKKNNCAFGKKNPDIYWKSYSLKLSNISNSFKRKSYMLRESDSVFWSGYRWDLCHFIWKIT